MRKLQGRHSRESSDEGLALVPRMLDGDESAFSAFFHEYFPRIYRFARPRLNGDADAANEVAQATLVKAMRHLAQFRGDCQLFAWMCQICRREVVNYLRSHRGMGCQLVSMDTGERRERLQWLSAPIEYEPMYRCERQREASQVHAVMDQLPAPYGDVLEWKYLDGESVEIIGQRLNVTAIAAQSLLARARRAFRGAMGSQALSP